ncbi:unnamed protein product [Brassica oleracea]
MDENAVGTWAELIFAQLMLLLLMMHLCFLLVFTLSLLTPQSPNQALDLVSVLEIGPARTTKASTDQSGNSGTCAISVMTIAFEFGVESHMQEHVASMARQYVRGILSPVQRVSLALSPSHISSQVGLRTPLGTPEAQTLARWICQSYRSYMGVELLKSNGEGSESILKNLWHHTDAIICCSMKEVCKAIARILALALDLDADYFNTSEMLENPIAYMRLLHYEGGMSDSSRGIYGCGAHTDHGMMTLLATDGVMGLQICKDKDMKPQKWEYVPSIDGAYIVNLGDVLERWSNGLFKSTMHRVLANGQDRYSIPFFLSPSHDCLIECLPTCQSENNLPKYPAITCSAYLTQ